MKQTVKAALVVMILAATARLAQAEVMFNYTGQPFSQFLGTAFDSSDWITGTVTFNAIGDTAAKSIMLSTTSRGAEGFSIDVADVTSPPVGLDVIARFTWRGSELETWYVDILGDIDGLPGDEELTIDKDAGDAAYLNFPVTGFSFGATAFGQHGEWTAVPEPSLAMLAFLGLTLGFFGFRRKWRK